MSESLLTLAVPPIPFVLSERRLRRPPGFFQKQHLEIDQSEPGRVGHVVIVGALILREQIAERRFSFVLAIGTDDKRFVHGLAEPLNRIGRAGAQHLCIRLHRQELRE